MWLARYSQCNGTVCEYSSPPGDVMNPDTTAFGFPTYLGLPQHVQSSNSGYFFHGWWWKWRKEKLMVSVETSSFSSPAHLVRMNTNDTGGTCTSKARRKLASLLVWTQHWTTPVLPLFPNMFGSPTSHLVPAWILGVGKLFLFTPTPYSILCCSLTHLPSVHLCTALTAGF